MSKKKPLSNKQVLDYQYRQKETLFREASNPSVTIPMIEVKGVVLSIHEATEYIKLLAYNYKRPIKSNKQCNCQCIHSIK
tara:strand:+ start:3119 stop:3358 length:240 start_codon:yes stop_codon:yes gene_type:complete